MKTLEDQMSFYAAYHQDARNKATHFVGVPLIVFSLMIPLGWLRVEVGGFTLSAALVVTRVLLLYYLVLDIPLGLAMCAVFALHALGRGAAVAGRRSATSAGLVPASCSSAAGRCSSGATSTRAASRRWSTTCSRSSSRRSFSPPRYSSR